MRATEFVTEAPRDVFHFVGHSPAVPRPTGNYYKWQVDLSNGQHYYIRAGAYTKLEQFQQYFARKWGAEMPDVEVVDATRLERLSEGDLEEMAGKVHGGVRKELTSKGYKYLGSGIDKQAFLEPGTGQILVIFGYGKWSKGKFSPDQLTFVDWAKYCQKNQSNPHLPRFSGWESFDYQGQRYLQIRMEPLKELPQNIKDIVSWLADYVNEKGKIDSKKVAKKIGARGVEEFDYDEGDFYQKKVKAKKIIEYLGGAQAAAGLMKTVQIAKRMANKQYVTLDLHGGNYMQRSDGTIVVNDPFVSTFF
jgi:hypothetical protein